MKIKELIKELQQYNKNADITLTTSEDICLSYISVDPNTNERLTEKTTLQVFIEPSGICYSCASEYMNGDTMWCSFYDRACKDIKECFEYEEF